MATDHKRLLRNLIVVTSQKNWDLFCKQCKQLAPSDPVIVFRYMVREAVLCFSPEMYDQNVEILKNNPKTIPLDTWRAEVGVTDKLYFELTPFHDRLLFALDEGAGGKREMTQDLLANPMQVAYPECMYKPLDWLPFTESVSFDGQNGVYLQGLLSGKTKT